MTRGGARERMVEGAARLLATKGVEGTSFSEVLAVADAPRGSVYHHFPGGKAELLRSALELVSLRGLAAMETTRGRPAVEVMDRFISLWRALLDRSKLTAGCAVVAVTVAAGDDELLDQAGAIFRHWTEQLTDLLAEGGVARAEARTLATMAIAATEGAVAVCRAERDRRPFDDVAQALTTMAASAVRPTSRRRG